MSQGRALCRMETDCRPQYTATRIEDTVKQIKSIMTKLKGSVLVLDRKLIFPGGWTTCYLLRIIYYFRN